MNLTYIPLLQVQRDLYTMPCGMERFRAYLGTIIDPETTDIKLPLAAMNPMGKEHLLPFLGELVMINADAVAADATAEAQVATAGVNGSFQVTVVVADDALGGWTNRFANEFGHRMGERAYHKRGWSTTLLWTSEFYTPDHVRLEVLLDLYRLAHMQRHGYPQTLRDLLAQEGTAMALAGMRTPTLDPDDIDYTREVLAEYLDATDTPTLLPALFGDVAARDLGYPPRGLSPYAGLALALHDMDVLIREGREGAPKGTRRMTEDR